MIASAKVMRFLLFALLLLPIGTTLAGGTVSFPFAEMSVAQDAGTVVIPINYVGTPTPLGTDDVQVTFVDGTADGGGYQYGWPNVSNIISYDFDSTQQTLNIPVPIRLMKNRGAIYFTVTLAGENGSTVGAISSLRVTIDAWTPPPAVLAEIAKLKSKIESLHRRIKDHATRRRVSRRLIRELNALQASITEDSEL